MPWASKNGHEHAIGVLLENGANIEYKDKYDQAPLFHAVHNGQEGATNVLLKYGANPLLKDDNGQNLLSRAAEYGRTSIVHKLLRAKFDDSYLNSKDNSGQTALARAVQSGQDEVVKLLLEQGADLNTTDKQGLTPLFRALSICRRRLFTTTNSDGLKMSLNGRWKILMSLVIKDNRYTRFMLYLIAHGADIQSKDDKGQTPLARATQGGLTPVVRLLLRKRADANLPDNHGHTPLMWTALEGHVEVTKLLLSGIVEIYPNAQSVFGRTALMSAASAGHRAVVEFLLNTPDIDLNVKDKYGRTALFEAQKRGYTKISYLLLSKVNGSGCVDPVITANEDLPDAKCSRSSRSIACAILKSSQPYCDICQVQVLDNTRVYHCKICENGNFDICGFCRSCGASCLGDDHELTEL